MNFKQFKQQVMQISKESFEPAVFHPLDYGIQRARFEEKKLKRLIAVAEQANSLTAKRRSQSWRRQLERTHNARARFETIKNDR